jgi:hypothetical protein
MFYTIYKITNKINGKFYIGKHQTLNLDDDYMGSGKYLKRAIQKYGVENFSKDILFIFDNADEMNSKEKELVTEEFCLNENTYNINTGGDGGFDYINNNKLNTVNQEYRNNPRYIEKLSIKLKEIAYTEKGKQQRKEAGFLGAKALLEKYPNGSFYGKTHKSSSKKLIGEKNSIAQKGENNSQYGTIWINDGKVNKKLKKDFPIPNGWTKGRIMAT